VSKYLIKAKIYVLRALTDEDFPSAREVAKAFIDGINLDELNGVGEGDSAPDDIFARQVELESIQSLVKFSILATQEVSASSLHRAMQYFNDQMNSEPQSVFDITEAAPNITIESFEVISVEKVSD